MRAKAFVFACIAFACHGRRIQTSLANLQEALKSGNSPRLDAEQTPRTDSDKFPAQSGLLFAQKPAINRDGSVGQIARVLPSSMTGAPHVATRNRGQGSSSRLPQSSLSVPASGPFAPASHTENPDEKLAFATHSPKNLRDAEELTAKRKSDLGKMALVFATIVLVSSIGLATRKNADHEGDAVEGDASRDVDYSRAADFDATFAKQSGHLKDGSSKLVKAPVVTSIASCSKEIEEAFLEQQSLGLTNGIDDQKEAAKAKRKWIEIVRQKLRGRRQRRLQHLQRMRKMRLQRLKAERLRMKRKMRTEFFNGHDDGLETRRSKERDEINKPPHGFYWKDPRKAVSQMMRIFRLWLLASRRLRRTEVEE